MNTICIGIRNYSGVGRLPRSGIFRSAALIRADLDILAEEGVRALTIHAAACRAGVSHNAPYRHFADLAFAAWGMVHGLALLLTDRQVPPALSATYDQEQLVRLCLRQHYDGLSLPVRSA